MSEKSRKRLTIGGLIFAIVCLILLSLKNQVYYPEMPARDAVKSAKAKKNFTYFEGSKSLSSFFIREHWLNLKVTAFGQKSF